MNLKATPTVSSGLHSAIIMRLHGLQQREFLRHGQSTVTLAHLYRQHLGHALKEKLESLSSDKKRIVYLAERTAEITNLSEFPQYLTMLFEIGVLVLNDDRHLNSITVIEQDGQYDYCPFFDQGAGLLPNTQFSPVGIAPEALIRDSRARPFGTTFNRQMHMAQTLYGRPFQIPRFSWDELLEMLRPLLEYYAPRPRPDRRPRLRSGFAAAKGIVKCIYRNRGRCRNIFLQRPLSVSKKYFDTLSSGKRFAGFPLEKAFSPLRA